MLTNEEAYNIVYRHLLTQRTRSNAEDDPADCLYHGPNDTRCAVGCLLTDEEAMLGDGTQPDGTRDRDQAMTMRELIERVPSVAKRIGHLDLMLLSGLQHTHDCFEPRHWTSQLDVVWENHLRRNDYERGRRETSSGGPVQRSDRL